MAYQDFKMQILNAAFNLAGTVITQTMKGGIDKYEELTDAYYKKTSKIVEKSQQEQKYRRQDYVEKTPEPEYVAVPQKDLTSTKIEQGTACLSCVPPDSLVLSNPGVKQMQELSMAQRVLDKNGSYTEIVDVQQR
jgi:hypothetical protein